MVSPEGNPVMFVTVQCRVCRGTEFDSCGTCRFAIHGVRSATRCYNGHPFEAEAIAVRKDWTFERLVRESEMFDEQELLELWHTARIPTTTRYGQMCLAAKWYAKGDKVIESRAYKVLSRIVGRDY